MKRFVLDGRSVFWLALPALVSGACYPDPLTVGETDVVVTARDPDRSYSSYRTYALPSEIYDLCEVGKTIGEGGAGGEDDEDDEEDCKDIDHRFDDEILQAIADNLEKLGYEEADNPESADIVVMPGVTAQDNWYVYYPYCDYWYGYYWYPYCWYYPWTPTAVNYPIGTLVMYMVAPADADEEAETMPVVWMGLVRGMLSSTSETNAARAEAGVNQAFAQSKYLGEGK